MAARKRRRKAGYCMECGEKLEGQKVRWCSPKCASKVYLRARRIAFDAFAPPNTHCVVCGDQVDTIGKWYCSPICRAEARKHGQILPSRYDRPEFF